MPPWGPLVDQLVEPEFALPATDLVSWGAPVGMDPDEVMPSLERFAAAVMPHFLNA